MESKLLIYIVSYQRKSYTQGTIEALDKVRPSNSEVIICDNGSTDGTREWLTENQVKYNLTLLYPEQNLRVGGAWTLLTNYFTPNDFDYILLLDNDGWFLPKSNWYKDCLDIFESHINIGSLGLQQERKSGYFSMEKTFDPNYNNKRKFKDLEFYDTVYYAAFRLDRFDLWYKAMSNWPHKFIGDKLGAYYNNLGYRTLKLTPGYIIDISEYNFNNEEHLEYNKDFYQKERDQQEFNRRMEMHSTQDKDKQFVIDQFGSKYLKFL